MIWVDLWVGEHRRLLLAAFAVCLWAAANYWYLRVDFARLKGRRKPRAWSVDMETRGSKGFVKRDK